MKNFYKTLASAALALFALPALAFTPGTTFAWDGSEPANGTQVESLDVIYVYFSANDTDYIDASWSAEEFLENLVLTDGVNTYPFRNVSNSKFTAKPYFKFTLKEAITTGGTYTLTIPENSVYIYNADFEDEQKVSPEFTASWTIADAGEVVQAETEFESVNPAVLAQVLCYVYDSDYEKEFSLLKSNTSAEVYDASNVKVATASIMELAPGTFALNPDNTVTTAGTYTITIPKGTFGGDGFIADVCTGEVEIAGCSSPGKVSITPDNSSPLTELSGKVTITFEDYDEICFTHGVETGSTVLITGPNGFSSKYAVTLDANTATIEIDEAITAEGIYHLRTALADFAYFGDEDVYFEGLDFEYTIGDGMYYDISIDPAPGTVASFKDFNITFGGAQSLSIKEDAGPSDFPYYGKVADDGTITKVQNMMFGPINTPEAGDFTTYAEASSPVLNIYTYAEVTEVGKYAIVLPAGAVYVDNQPFENDLVFKYTIDGEVVEIEYTVACEPADGANVKTLDEIKFTFSTETEGVTFKCNSLLQPEFARYEDGAAVQAYNGTFVSEDNVIVWTPYYGTVTDEGDYVFKVGEGWMTMTDADGNVTKSEAITLSFHIDGTDAVEAVVADGNEALNVYNLQGIQILKNAGEDALDSLPSGLYIVNGEKRLIKH